MDDTLLYFIFYFTLFWNKFLFLLFMYLLSNAEAYLKQTFNIDVFILKPMKKNTICWYKQKR